jgi:hypothetical protein
LIGLIFIPLCKISVEVNDGCSIDKENHLSKLDKYFIVHTALQKKVKDISHNNKCTMGGLIAKERQLSRSDADRTDRLIIELLMINHIKYNFRQLQL